LQSLALQTKALKPKAGGAKEIRRRSESEFARAKRAQPQDPPARGGRQATPARGVGVSNYNGSETKRSNYLQFETGLKSQGRNEPVIVAKLWDEG